MRKRANSLETIHRRKFIAARKLRGQSPRDICNALEISLATYYRDEAAIKASWLERTQESRAAWLAEIIAGIEEIHAEAMKAWERSREPEIVEKTRLVGEGPDAETTSEIVRKAQAGNGQFLLIALQCRIKIAELKAVAEQPGDRKPTGEELMAESLMDVVAADREAEEYLRANRLATGPDAAASGNP